LSLAFEPPEHDWSPLRGGSAYFRGFGIVETRGLRVQGINGSSLGGLALDREQQLMKLAPDSPLSWAILEIAKGALETT
jgi:hypothetical protein